MLGLVIGYILTTRSYTIFQQLGESTLICITIWQGNLEVNTSTDLVLVWYFSLYTISTEMIITRVFLFWKAPTLKLKSLVQVQYNKSLANFACSSSTDEYWPLFVFEKVLVFPYSELVRSNDHHKPY